MGEVYRARDSKLGRQVAVKVLPEAFSRDPDRMARFERESRVLASLNHTNIATIYGVEDSNASRALVMELVEGPTLADRLRAGPIPINEALPVARQICDALEYAHEHGVIHRDLKPANIKVTPDDSVKVLDFGLAKALEGDPSSIDIATSPTMSRMATQAGILLGTAAYMSPEQAKAKQLDRRTDIWSFGCVLYEMLTGKMAFRGETVTDTLAAVIKEEPDWSKLPSATPVRVRVLLQRCLQKDPKLRLRDIGDARISLDEVISGAPDAAPGLAASGLGARGWRAWLIPGLAGLFAASTAVLGFLYSHTAPAAAPDVARFEIPLPDRVVSSGVVRISPDGRKLIFIARGSDGQTRVWMRSLDTTEVHPLDGTDGAGDAFWSADSRSVAFAAPGKLKKVEAAGGPPLPICDISNLIGGAWSHGDEVVFGTVDGMVQVPASGGSPVPLTQGWAGVFPAFLPDMRHFLYTRPGGNPNQTGVYLASTDTKPADQPATRLLADVSPAVYTPSPDSAVGHLLFLRGASAIGGAGTLMAQPFDPQHLKLAGEAVPIAEGVSLFTASSTGILVYGKGSQAGTLVGMRGIVQGQLTWFDRDGKVLGTFADPGSYRTLALSPDGKRIVFDRADPQNPNVRNLWLYEFARGVTTRFTFDTGAEFDPVWSPDGSRIAFTSARSGVFDLYQKASDMSGEDEALYKSEDPKASSSWSPDGRFLLYFNPIPPVRQWLLPLSGTAADRKPIRLDNSQFDEAAGRISPDGRWIAYGSSESGRQEIYVRPLDLPGAAGSSPVAAAPVSGKWMVSKDGGTTPLWSRDGKEIFYLSAVGGMAMTVPVNTGRVFQAGIPKPLFKLPPGVLFWDVTSDGKRFVMAAPASASTASLPFTVVLNWQSALKK